MQHGHSLALKGLSESEGKNSLGEKAQKGRTVNLMLQ